MTVQKTGSGNTTTGAEGGRRPTGGPVETIATTPEPEVVARTTRRQMTTAYKLKVLDTVAALREQGQGAIGAYLRSEGLYYSNIHTWERQKKEGILTVGRTGPKEKSRDSLLVENKQLRRKLEQTEKRLKKTEMIVELQKKLSAFMETEMHQTPEMSAEK
jgi:transposase